MKITKAGDPKIAEWWIGQTLICQDCGAHILLEAGDEKSAYWVNAPLGYLVVISCPCCNRAVEKQNEAKPTRNPITKYDTGKI